MSVTDWASIRTALPPLEDAPPRHGRIRLGETYLSASGKELPRALDHFVVVADDRGTTLPEAAAAFHRAYGENATTLRAWLPGDKPEDVYHAAYRLYGTRKLKRKCSGPPSAGGTAHAMQRRENGTLEACACECDKLPVDSRLRCSFGWELLLLLPDVSAGVWDIVSGSEIGWRRIAAELQHAYALAGSLHLLEVDVVLVPTAVNPEGKSKTVWTVSVRPVGNVRQLVAGEGRYQLNPGELERAAISVVPDRYALPASSLDAEPDALIHHPAIADAPAGSAVSASGSESPATATAHPPIPPGPQPTDAQPETTSSVAVPAPGGVGGAAGDQQPSLKDQYHALSDADRDELRRRVPIPQGTTFSALAVILGPLARDLAGVLVMLRTADCSLAEFRDRAQRFEDAAVNDTLPPSESQELREAGHPEPGDAIPMYGPGAPS